MTSAAEPVSADVEVREPRCRICRDKGVRILVNEMLDWRGVPIILGRGKIHRVTYADILRTLDPFNEGRGNKDRITYDCLWVHARRHYDLAGIVAYWAARMDRELRNALGITVQAPMEFAQKTCINYEEAAVEGVMRWLDYTKRGAALAGPRRATALIRNQRPGTSPADFPVRRFRNMVGAACTLLSDS